MWERPVQENSYTSSRFVRVTGSRNTGIQLGTLLVHKVGAGGARGQRRRSTTLEERQKRAQGMRFPEFLEKENDSLTPDEKTALSLLSKLDEWLQRKHALIKNLFSKTD